MKRIELVRVAGTLIVGASLLFGGGCGYKTDPVPPDSVVPRPIGDLVYEVDDTGVMLNWTYPVKTIEGRAIENISAFDLYRAEIALDDFCPTCPIPFGVPIEIDGGAPIDGESVRQATYTSSQLSSGHKYFFKVQSRTSWLAASDDSNIVTFVYFEPAQAPGGFAVKAGDGEVTLSWQSVSALSNGEPVKAPLLYQVFKSVGGSELEKIGSPLSGNSFVDRQVRNGQKYFYAVQSLMRYEDDLVNGGKSEAVAVTPVDLTPPLPPSGVTAVGTDSGTKIFWDKSQEADVAGYLVYRRASDKDDYELLGKIEPEYNIFVDKDIDGYVRYYYAVTAIDLANPPNESIKSKEATIRY